MICFYMRYLIKVSARKFVRENLTVLYRFRSLPCIITQDTQRSTLHQQSAISTPLSILMRVTGSGIPGPYEVLGFFVVESKKVHCRSLTSLHLYRINIHFKNSPACMVPVVISTFIHWGGLILLCAFNADFICRSFDCRYL